MVFSYTGKQPLRWMYRAIAAAPGHSSRSFSMVSGSWGMASWVSSLRFCISRAIARWPMSRSVKRYKRPPKTGRSIMTTSQVIFPVGSIRPLSRYKMTSREKMVLAP